MALHKNGPLLIVDDDEDILELYQTILESDGYNVVTASTGKEAIEKAKESKFKVAVVDIILPDIGGDEVAIELKSIDPSMEIIFITGYSNFIDCIDALEIGIYEILLKPINNKELLRITNNTSLNTLRFNVSRFLSNLLIRFSFERKVSALRKVQAKKIIPFMKKKVICSTLFNTIMLVDPQDLIGKSIYYYGEYEAGTMSILKEYLHEGDKFLDAGAYIGEHACAVAKFVGDTGTVYAFEPNPESFKILKTNITINKLTNIIPFQTALGAEEKEARIYNANIKNRGSSSLIRAHISVKDEESSNSVIVTTIDRLIKERKIDFPDFIKIDVEGFELEILKGAEKLLQSSKAPMLCVEYSNLHPQYDGDVEEIYEYIKSINNYNIFKLKYGKDSLSRLLKISSKKDLPNHDNIFCFRTRKT